MTYLVSFRSYGFGNSNDIKLDLLRSEIEEVLQRDATYKAKGIVIRTKHLIC